jgi:hypothetical protein
MLLAVHDGEFASATFAAVLGAEKVRVDTLGAPYNARRTTVQAGDSEFDLLEPDGAGLVEQYLQTHREGIFGAGFATADLEGVERSLAASNIELQRYGSQLFVEPGQTRGMRTVIQASEPRSTVGLITHLYEVTNIVNDWEEAAGFYAAAFGLDAARFSPLTSSMWGYTGTLTLFDPPSKLDRIELTQITEPRKAMGRFFEKHGPSVYMCFAETEDAAAIQARLDEREARWTPTENEYPGAGLFIHPTSLHGMLMGISYTNVAWLWSGRPELAPARRSA